MLRMTKRERVEYEAMQRQENRERALSRLRSMSMAATSALTDGGPFSPTPRRPIDIRHKPKRKTKAT